MRFDESQTHDYAGGSVQPGRLTSARIQDCWFDTAAEQALPAIHAKAARDPDTQVEALAAMSLVPRAVDVALEERADG